MKSRSMILGVLVLVGAYGQSAIARNERVPPPRTYISSGGLGDSEPWLPTPDDPNGGGGGGSGGGGTGGGGMGGGGTGGGGTGNNGGPQGGDLGRGPYNWWNDPDFWGWGSGWWRYRDPVPPSGGGGGGEGGGSLGGGCERSNVDRAKSCDRVTLTGVISICGCIAIKNGATGNMLECGTCYPGAAPYSLNCRGKQEGDECGN